MSAMANRPVLWALATALLALLPVATTGQSDAPIWSVEFARPKQDQALTGVITVSVRVLPVTVKPSHLSVGFGDAYHVPMKPVAGTHYWRATVDTTQVLNGPAQLRVYGMASGVSNRRAGATLAVAVDNSLDCYFGNIHAHTYYSDGSLSPAEAYTYARDVAGLDFFCLADHLEQVSEDEWRDTRSTAWAMNEDGRFAAFPALEWTKSTGHANLFDPPGLRWPAEMEGLFEVLAERPVLGMFNHPGDGTGNWGWKGLPYHEGADESMQLVEVRSDEELKGYILALNNGWHIAAAGTDDTHAPDWGMSGAWTGLWLPYLSTRNVIDALGRRNCFATSDRNCRLMFEANGAPMGTVVAEPTEQVSLKVTVSDPDPGDTIDRIEIYHNGKIIDTPRLGAQQGVHATALRPEPGDHYFLVRVIQADGDLLTSAPVWLTVP